MLSLTATQPFAEFDTANFKPRQPLFHPKVPFVLMWSEKAACTTVVRWFFHQCGLLDEALAYRPWVHDYENDVFKARPGYLDSMREAVASGVPVVKFTRDPFARAFSGYLEICRTAVVTTKGHWARPLRARILRALVGTDAEIEYAFSFRQYVEWLSFQDVPHLNLHIAPQHLRRDEFFNLRVVQIESLSESLKELEREAGFTQSLPDKYFESGHHHQKSEALSHHQQLGMLEVAVPLRRPDKFQFPSVDRELLRGTPLGASLSRIFEEDITRYGY